MKRFFMMLVLAAIVAGTSGCATSSNCPSPHAQGNGFGSNFARFKDNLGIPHGNVIPSLIADGPVRRWFRGDSCDECNVPAGQISFDNGFDSSCTTGACNPPSGEPIYGVPSSIGAPVNTGYTPIYGEVPMESSVPDLNMGYQGQSFSSDPYSVGNFSDGNVNNYNGPVFDGVADSIEIPPMGN